MAALIGSRIPRIEDEPFLRGTGRYVDDIEVPGLLHASFVRSPHPHAAIRGVSKTAALALPGVHAVLTLDGLTPVADCRKAIEPGSPTVRRELNSNIVATYKVNFGDPPGAFAKAAHVFHEDLWQHRGAGHPIEGRGILVETRPRDDSITVFASTQKSHDLFQSLTSLLDFDEAKLRVKAPDIGGGFGPKLCVYSEDIAVVAAAKLMNRSIKWIEDRREHFTNAAQERDQYWSIDIAVAADGKLMGVRGTLVHDVGAYALQDVNIPFNSASMMSGPYILPSLAIDVTVAATNKTPVSSIRGAGYPQAAFAMERMMDRVARELKLDRAELRRRNLIPAV